MTNRLKQKVAEVTAKTEAAHQKNLEKRANKPPAVVKPRKENAATLCEFLRNRIKDGLSSVTQPNITKKDLDLMRQLKEEIGVEKVKQVITYLCDPTHWSKVMKQFKINHEYPTVPILWGFRGSIVPLALNVNQPKRSGNASIVDGVIVKSEKDAYDEENGSFG